MTQALLGSIHDEARVPKSNAGWRNVIGDIAERLAADRMGAIRQNTGMGLYCPDLRWRGIACEVKACGRSNTIIIYSVRLAKDRHFALTNKLLYVVVKHCVEIPQASAHQAKLMMEDALIYVFPFEIVDAVCVSIQPRILNHKYKPSNGWCQRGYDKGGYQVPLKSLLEVFPFGRIQ